MDSDHVCRTLEKAFVAAGFPGIRVEYWGFDPDDYDCEDGLTGFYSAYMVPDDRRMEFSDRKYDIAEKLGDELLFVPHVLGVTIGDTRQYYPEKYEKFVAP